jgi:hypothetical protein
MSISPTDRKLLWGKAGNRCAVPACRRVLVAEPTEADPEAIIGEEAHIVARSEDGPRGGLIQRHLLDRYDNLILLCPSCHTMIDKQFESWTRGRLLDIREQHERWVNERLSATKGPSDNTAPIQIIPLAKPEFKFIQSGAELWDLISGADRYYIDGIEDDDADGEIVDEVDAFLQSVVDYGEISGDVEMNGRHAIRLVKREFDQKFARFMVKGIHFVGARRPTRITGGIGNDQYWSDLFLSAYTLDHPFVKDHLARLEEHRGGMSEEERAEQDRELARRVERLFTVLNVEDVKGFPTPSVTDAE